MRKTGYVALALVAIAAIVLVVRGQVRATPEESVTAPAAGMGAPSSPNDTSVVGAEQPGALEAQDQSPAAPASANSSRPIVSGHIGQPQANPAEAAQTAGGAAVLKRAATAYANVRSMRADFVQRRENPLLGSTLTSRGILYQRSPDRFALKFTQPAGDVIIADGRYFWVYYPSVDRRQVIRATASAEGAGAIDLKAQFIGDPVQRFRHTYHGTEQLSGRTVHVLTLTPRQDVGYKTLKVWIDALDSLVRRFQITEPTGADVEFHLSNVVVNPTIGNDVFRFTPPADAVVIER